MRLLILIVYLTLPITSECQTRPHFCAPIFQRWTKQHRLVGPAMARAREVLGDSVTDDNHPEVRFLTCLPGIGCKYSSTWHVIQMDQETLLHNPEAFGAIYVHELAHSIQLSSKPEIRGLRSELADIRNRQLAGWARAQRFRKNIYDPNIAGGAWGLWYFFSNAESRLTDMEQKLVDELNKKTGAKELPNNDYQPENGTTLDFLQSSAGEVFADLASCSAYSDGDIIARALTALDGKEHPERKNSTLLEIPETPDWVKTEHQDVHHFFALARRLIWDHHLKGKPKAETQRLLKILDRHTIDWPSEMMNKHFLDPSGRGKIDKNQLNRLFLNSFLDRLAITP